MGQDPAQLVVTLSSGLGASDTLRLLQLSLALARKTKRNLVLFSGSLGVLRLCEVDDQLILCHARAFAASDSYRPALDTVRVRMGSADSLGSGPDLRALVVLPTPEGAQAVRDGAHFGEVIALGEEQTPFAVDVQPQNAAPHGGSGVLLLACGELESPQALAQTLEKLGQQYAGPTTLFDPYDAYAAPGVLPQGIKRVGPVPPSRRAQLFSERAVVAALGDGSLRDDCFAHEAFALGLRAADGTAPPTLQGMEALTTMLGARLDGDRAAQHDGAIRHVDVGDSQVCIGAALAKLVERWRTCAAEGIECVLLVDGGARGCEQLKEPLSTLPLAQMWLLATEHGALAPQLLSAALRGVMQGRFAQGPELVLCESSDVQATRLRQWVMQTPARCVLVWLPHATSGLLSRWCHHAQAAKARYERVGALPEPRVLATDLLGLTRTASLSEHRIGSTQASGDIAAGLRDCAPGYASLVSLTPAVNERRARRIFFEPGSLLPVSKHRLHCAPSWYLHELKEALLTRQLGAMINVNGPLVGILHAARLAWADYALPVLAVIHALHIKDIERAMLEVHIEQPLRRYDWLISPSACGRTTMQKVLESVYARCEARGIPPPTDRPGIAVIPYGIERTAFGGRHKLASRVHLGLPLHPVTLVSVMRFSRHNKADLVPLILALKALVDEGCDVQLVLAGQQNEGDEPERLGMLATKLGVGEHLIFRRNLSAHDKLQLLMAADVFVALSDNVQETYGVGVLEAMATGLPVVASAWNGFRELVRDGVTGLLVPALWRLPSHAREEMLTITRANSQLDSAFDFNEMVAIEPAALVAKLRLLVHDAELRERMGEQARRIVASDYDRDKQGQKILELIEEARAMAAQAASVPTQRLRVDAMGARFAHYSDAHPHDDDRLQLGSMAQDQDSQASVLEALYNDDVAGHEYQASLSLLRRVGQSSLLWHEARRPQCDDARLLRALKYGLVERSPGP